MWIALALTSLLQPEQVFMSFPSLSLEDPELVCLSFISINQKTEKWKERSYKVVCTDFGFLNSRTVAIMAKIAAIMDIIEPIAGSGGIRFEMSV